MPGEERRQHIRIDDYVYFDYRIIKPNEFKSDMAIRNDLLGDSGQKYMEAMQYFQTVDYELARLGKTITDQTMAHYLNLLNTKIDYLAHQMMIPLTITSKKVNISLGGMAFSTINRIEDKTTLKILLYTKPRLIPIIIEGSVVYSKHQSDTNYRTAVAFSKLTTEQEQLLSQHILMGQVTCKAD